MYKKIFMDAFYLISSEIISKVLFFVLLYFMARAYGPEGLGQYAFVFSLGAIFLIFANWGTDDLIVRELNKIKNKSEFLGNVIFLNIVLGLLFFGLLILISYLFLEKFIFSLVLLLSLLLFVDNLVLVFFSIFRFHEKMFYEGLVRLLHNVLIVGLSIFFVLNGFGLYFVFVSFLIGKIFAFLVSFFILFFKFTLFKLNFNFSYMKKIIVKSFPLLLLYFSGIFIYRVDIVMLKYFENFRIVGFYDAAHNLIRNFGLFFIVFGQVLYARFCKIQKSKKLLLKYYKIGFAISFVFSILFLVVIFLFGDWLINLVYGDEFVLSYQILKLLSFSAIFYFMMSINVVLFNSINKSWYNVLIFFFGGFLNFFVNYFLIPLFSWKGAVIASVISYCFMVFLYLFFVLSNFSKSK